MPINSTVTKQQHYLKFQEYTWINKQKELIEDQMNTQKNNLHIIKNTIVIANIE